MSLAVASKIQELQLQNVVAANDSFEAANVSFVVTTLLLLLQKEIGRHFTATKPTL